MGYPNEKKTPVRGPKLRRRPLFRAPNYLPGNFVGILSAGFRAPCSGPNEKKTPVQGPKLFLGDFGGCFDR